MKWATHLQDAGNNDRHRKEKKKAYSPIIISLGPFATSTGRSAAGIFLRIGLSVNSLFLAPLTTSGLMMIMLVFVYFTITPHFLLISFPLPK
jgi:hypothetical protein